MKNIEPLEKQLVGRAASLLPFLKDSKVTDILINGIETFFIEREGELHGVPHPFNQKENIFELIERMVVPLGKRIDAAQPYLDGRLLDGSRFHVILPPIAINGPLISIRKNRRGRGIVLSDFGPPKVVEFLVNEVSRGANLLIAGGTGAGKTSLLSCLLEFVSPNQRITVIEETTEIYADHPHLLHLEARPPTPDGKGEVTLQALVKNALRMRPDRLILGECRGPEAFDMLHAMNTGHRGALGTIHANSALDALKRLEGLATLTGFGVPMRTLKEWVAAAIHGVVFMQKRGDSRQVSEIISVNGLEGDLYRVTPRYKLQPLTLATS